MKLWLISILVISFLASRDVNAEDDFDDEDDVMVDDDFDVEDDQPEINLPKKERPVYSPPKPKGSAHFADAFVSEDLFNKRWSKSQAKKDDTDDDIAKYDGKWGIEEPEENPLKNDLSLVLKSKAKHHAVAAKLDKPFQFTGKPLVVQYEVKFQSGQECGGAYIKLLSDDSKLNLKQFRDKTPYTIMFGPDKCGNDEKLHFIFRHKNPLTGEFEEKHAKKPPSVSLSNVFSDKKTHIFKLIVNPDNSFEVYVDGDMAWSGSLLEDVNPPVNPPKEIEDPEDKKPEDWDEREKIPDPDATKPDDWDESAPEYIEDEDAEMPDGWLEDVEELIPDPDAEKPNDWDDDMDGEWEAPMISNPDCESAPGCGPWTRPQIKNPEYKGKWKAPRIDNPNYKGKWKPRMIDNPDFFEDLEPYKMTPIGAIGLELWSMSNEIAFDNFLITDDKSVADQWTQDTWELKHTQELDTSSSGQSVVDAVLEMTNDRPWLWAVILVVLVLPVVLLIAYCCAGSSSKPDEAAARKKTDAPSPDDKPSTSKSSKSQEQESTEEEEEEKGEDEDGAGDAKSSAKSSPKKSSPKKSAKKPSKSDLNADEADQEADAEEDDAEEEKPTRSSPRKRATRSRKE